MSTITISSEELQTIIATAIASSKKEKRLIYGVKALAEALGYRREVVQRFKKQNLIPYTQVRRKIIFDFDEVVAALNPKDKVHE